MTRPIPGWRARISGRWTTAAALPLAALCAWFAFSITAKTMRNSGDPVNTDAITTLVVEAHDEWTGDPARVPPAPRATRASAAASIAIRNHNPLNIKYGAATLKYITQGIASISRILPRDGGRFLKFESDAAGFRAAVELLTSPLYTSLDVDGALKRWSNNGYGAEIVRASVDPSSSVADLQAESLEHVVRAMATVEGYRSSDLTQDIARAVAAAQPGQAASSSKP